VEDFNRGFIEALKDQGIHFSVQCNNFREKIEAIHFRLIVAFGGRGVLKLNKSYSIPSVSFL